MCDYIHQITITKGNFHWEDGRTTKIFKNLTTAYEKLNCKGKPFWVLRFARFFGTDRQTQILLLLCKDYFALFY